MKSTLKLYCLTAFCLFTGLSCFAHSSGMEITLSMDQKMDMYSNGGKPRVRRVRYEEPVDNTFVLKEQLSNIYVILHNASKDFKKLYSSSEDEIYCISFELTDEKGKKTIIRHKPPEGRRPQRPSSYIKPGQTQIYNIYFNPHKWENIINITSGKVRKYTLRAMYDNKNEIIYSNPYTLIMDGTQSPATVYKKEKDKDQKENKEKLPDNIILLKPTPPKEP